MRVDTRAPYLQRVRSWDEGRAGLIYPGDDESILPVYALADYDGVARHTIVSWKNSVTAGLTEALVDLVAQRATEIELDAPVSVVPAPSSWRRRHDGRLVTLHIARGLSAGLNRQAHAEHQKGAGVQRAEGRKSELAVVDEVLSQGSITTGLSMSRGRARLSGRGRKGREIRVRRQPSRRRVIVVDDVLTSGATLAGCSDALARGGSEVIAAFVLAAARDPRGSS
ncbi:MAG: phosphoribosyltransferase family protein [Ancrocorticia sp.]